MELNSKNKRGVFVTLTAACLAFAALAAMPAARAGALAIETGWGDFKSRGTESVFLRYLNEAPPLFGYDSFHDFSLASWNGPNHNNAIGIARGLRRTWRGEKYLSASGGLGYVAQKTDYLGTHLQFVLHLAFGSRFGNYDLSIAQVHYSNGKKIFGWDGPNRGQDFLTLQLGREF